MLLRVVTMTSPAIGLWCAYLLAGVFVQPAGNNAPLPRAADPLQPFSVIVHTVPITTDDFNDRWQLPITTPRVDQPVRESATTFHQVSQRHHQIERHRDICERHGMHKRYYHRGRYLSWRCRR